MNTESNKKTHTIECSTSSMIAALAVLIAIAAVFFAGIMYAKSGNVNQQPTLAAPVPTPQPAPPAITPDLGLLKVRSNDAVRGSNDILLIEYSDYECPFCQRFHGTAQELVDSGEVAWIYRHLPLSFHQTAKEGAIIAECVRLHKGTGAFWTYTDSVFDSGSLDLEVYKSLARTAALSDAQIDECLAAGSEAQKTIDQHASDTKKMGVRGTPGSFLVNTKNRKVQSIPGALPVEEVRRILESIQ